MKALMERDERRRQMLNDPDLTGDLLLFALALDEVILTRSEDGRRRKKPGHWVADVAALAVNVQRQQYWGRKVLTDDVPRYEPVGQSHSMPCAAPMIRREGLCGKHGTTRLIDRDPHTGEAKWIGLCARHRGHQAHFDARLKEWHVHGKPMPPANTGGVLRRYWDADWDHIYRWAAPHREPMEGGREATPPRPRLRLIQGGDGEVSS